ncbi:MAG: phosphoribosylformylglycinamidine synthase subunit PurL [Rhodospirillales bacterium]|nr:phosphoribosylformylglycinamidine synthase subunit PurL [Rhodospirillales bacterium]
MTVSTVPAHGRNEPKITPEIVRDHGLKPDEYDRVVQFMGREPNMVELGIVSVMWSEHCSYKSSRRWLKTLPTTGKVVIQGPGENAGVIDIGDGQAAVFKMESHNHPSFIEPYQGAATGVGGIMRDVFTMGARPIANLNALRFGSPDHPKTRHLVAGVVAGIGGYGNCMGVPTVGGECNFHPAYNGNILVNAMTVGLAPADRIFYSAAAGLGNQVVYVGAKTGRDGIHGATMASAEFSEDNESKRPTVQVGDPFTEKLLLEACLELMATDAIVAIQDMGAAGLTCSSVEMADKGGLGIELDLDQVPMRETGMSAYEIMLSESQERMLMVLKPGTEAKARAVFDKYALDFAVVGRLTDTGRFVMKQGGKTVGDMPVKPLVEQAPQYDRPFVETPKLGAFDAATLPAPENPLKTLHTLMGRPDLASKRWIWEQYDHLVRGDTVIRPGGDAAVVRIGNGPKAIAVTSDCTPRYCKAEPKAGGAQAVVEAWRNLTAVGALPLAATDNLNFGNPEKPPIMGQLVGCIQGMGEACRALDFPIVSGNVSLYNETNGEAILPTPVIGAVGLLDDVHKAVGIAPRKPGVTLVLVGETRGWLGQSIYLREIHGREEGAPPPVDLAVEKRNGDFVRRQIQAGKVEACHDLGDGGLLVAAAEMALASNLGLDLTMPPAGARADAWWFGEDQARYLVATDQPGAVLEAAKAAGVPARSVGVFTPEVSAEKPPALTVAGVGAISLPDLRHAHEHWLPAYMAGPGRKD